MVAAIFVVALNRHMAVDDVRALTFFGLVIAIVALILANRTNSSSLVKAVSRPNKALAIVLPLLALMLAVTIVSPFVRKLFQFGSLPIDDGFLAIGTGLVVLVVLESIKALRRRRFDPRRNADCFGRGPRRL